MSMAEVLAAVICGFIGGVLGAMVLHEALDQRFTKKASEDAQQWALLNHRVEKTVEQYNFVALALERLTYRFKRERGALWESLNALWNEWDRYHKPETAAVPDEPEAEPVTDGTEDTETAENGTEDAGRENDTNETEQSV